MGWTIRTSFCARVTFSMRSPVATSNGCAPVFASYSAMTRFTSSMSAVAGSYSRIVVSPWDENVRTLAFISGLLRDFIWLPWERSWRGWSLNAIMHRCGKMSRRHFHGAKAENSLLLVLGDWRRTQTGSGSLFFNNLFNERRALQRHW